MNGLDMALHDNFRHNVRKRRLELGMTQQQLANKLRVSRAYVAQVEAGESIPTLGVVEKFAKALDCSSITLLVVEEREKVPA